MSLAIAIVAAVSFPVIVGADALLGIWSPGPSMAYPRDGHTATALKDGRVLVVGITAEIFDPATNRWSVAGTPPIRLTGHTATLLADGRVLVAGGIDGGTGRSVPNAEVYDPASNAWTPVAPMAGRRYDHSASLLADNRVLVTGGTRSTVTLDSAEIYDPSRSSWTAAANLLMPRTGHAAIRLADGRVLVAGGNGPSDVLATAEIYDPATDRWSATDAMVQQRRAFSAVLLHGGRVLVAGGRPVGDSGAVFAEIFDPGTGRWSAAAQVGQPSAGDGFAMTLLRDGRVLICGGAGPGYPSAALAAGYVYDPVTDHWWQTADMAQPRVDHSASLLSDGRVLIAGGRDEYTNGTSLNTTEFFEAGAPPTATASPATTQESGTSTAASRAVDLQAAPFIVLGIVALTAISLIALPVVRRRRRR